MKSKRLRAFDRARLSELTGLIGIDEAGRGALAGPVVASAVAVYREFYDTDWCKRNASRINDSKLLAPDEREYLYGKLRWLESKNRLHIGVGWGDIAEIENLNILGATQAAMRRAVEGVFESAEIEPHEPDPLFADVSSDRVIDGNYLSSWRIFVDGKPMKQLGYPHQAFVQGDSRSLCIAMASIIAKVTRDRTMMALDCQYPKYDLASSKGYATPSHRSAIVEEGPSPVHRSLFLKKILEANVEDLQSDFGF
ncbi:MAG: ribonuclease HII [Opitutales bacterium]|nr:ribonuclease HII [Opitutales bacterium]